MEIITVVPASMAGTVVALIINCSYFCTNVVFNGVKHCDLTRHSILILTETENVYSYLRKNIYILQNIKKFT